MSQATNAETTTQSIERNMAHEAAWFASGIMRTIGHAIKRSDTVSLEDNDHPKVRLYFFFQDIRESAMERIPDDSVSNEEYRRHHGEPDEDTWTNEVAPYIGKRLQEQFANDDAVDTEFDVDGVTRIPSKVALNELGIEYGEEGVLPIFVPSINGTAYDPTGITDGYDLDALNAKDTEADTEAEESDVPPWEQEETADTEEDEDLPPWESADAEDTTEDTTETADADEQSEEAEEEASGWRSYTSDQHDFLLTDFPNDEEMMEMDRRDLSVLFKLQNPTRTLRDIAELMEDHHPKGYSKTSVSDALKDRLGQDGYDRLKEMKKALNRSSIVTDDEAEDINYSAIRQGVRTYIETDGERVEDEEEISADGDAETSTETAAADGSAETATASTEETDTESTETTESPDAVLEVGEDDTSDSSAAAVAQALQTAFDNVDGDTSDETNFRKALTRAFIVLAGDGNTEALATMFVAMSRVGK